jgi:hypothetical protein
VPSNISNSAIDPACDFPPEVADLYPKDFRYPEGYFPRPTRVLDRAVLKLFQDLERPYLILDSDGEPTVAAADWVSFERLLKKLHFALMPAIRYLEGDGSNESLRAKSDEKRLQFAEDAADNGFMGLAVATVRALPERLQTTHQALRILVISLKALGRYREALAEVRRLIATPDPNYEPTRFRIEEADLVLLSGEPLEAERLLDLGRRDFCTHYEYFGVRAALAMGAGDRALAEHLIVRAGRADDYHCFKILWHPLLAPVRDVIRQELIHDSGTPLLYHQNSAVKRLCHRVQGALLVGRLETAISLAEGIAFHWITDRWTAQEAVLAMVGVGWVGWIDRAIGLLPGYRKAEFKLAHALAISSVKPDRYSPDNLRKVLAAVECGPSVRQTFEWLLSKWYGASLAETGASELCLIAVVSDHWRDGLKKGSNDRHRERWVLLREGGRFYAQGVLEGREERRVRDNIEGLLAVATKTERISFENMESAQNWLESHLLENRDFVPEPGRHSRWDVQFLGYGFLHAFQQKPPMPLMAERWERLVEHPRELSFVDRLVYLLRLRLEREQPRGGATS